MRVLHFDCFSGISGDMTLAALLDAGVDAEAVRQGLASLGFREVSDVRVGKYIEVSLDAPSEHEARQRVEAMCQQLLANHVIEDFHFEIEHEGRHQR